MKDNNKPTEPTSSTFKDLVKESWKLVDELKSANPNIDRVELSNKLNEHFPGLLEMSKELGSDVNFLAEVGATVDIMSATITSKSQEQVVQKLDQLNQLHTGNYALLHRDGVRFGVILGLELGFILSNLYSNQSKKDDDFDKFMRSLGMEPPKGSVQ